jgi:flagellar assembly protein FliH
MKKKKVFASPDIKGVHVFQIVKHPESVRSDKEKEIQALEEKKREEEEKRLKTIELEKEESYKKGLLDAEKQHKVEIEKIKNEFTSLITSFRDAIGQLEEKREKVWRESEPEIVRLVLAISRKVIGYEIGNNSINVVNHLMKEALSYVGDRKVVAVRLSPDDVKKINMSEETKITDQNIKILEDRTVATGGCVVEMDFGNVDSQIETRWEAVQKALLESKNDSTVH